MRVGASEKAEGRLEGARAATEAASVCGKLDEWGHVKRNPAALTTNGGPQRLDKRAETKATAGAVRSSQGDF